MKLLPHSYSSENDYIKMQGLIKEIFTYQNFNDIQAQ